MKAAHAITVVLSIGLVTTGALTTGALTTGAAAFDFGPRSFGEVYASRNCAWCHGSTMQGVATAPRLAGQRAAYIESQLLSLKTHGRDNPKSQVYMWGAAQNVDPGVAREVGRYLASLEPRPAADGDPRLQERGRAIYRDGDAAASVPSCVVCHGPEAQGAGAIPRIGGLSQRYLKRRLAQWGEGYHASARFPMPSVATNLSEEEIEALASYLSFVR